MCGQIGNRERRRSSTKRWGNPSQGSSARPSIPRTSLETRFESAARNYAKKESEMGHPAKNTIPREKLRRLAGELLGLASSAFANHGCNDFDRPSYFTPEEWAMMAAGFEQWNSGGRDEPNLLCDWVVMRWLSTLAKAGEL